MAEVLTHINSLTQQLYQSNGDIDRDYGSRIHDLLIYLKQVVSDEASNRAPHDNSMLDVSTTPTPTKHRNSQTKYAIAETGPIIPFDILFVYLASPS